MVEAVEKFEYETVECPNCDGKGIVNKWLFVEDNAEFKELEYKGLGVFTCKWCRGKKRLPIIDKREEYEE